MNNNNTPSVEEPVTPTRKSAQREKATELFNSFQGDYERYVAAMNNLGEDPQVQYPTSPGPPGTVTTFGKVPLANLGIVPGATGHSGHVVQYGKPKEADVVKLLAFPKPGMSFDKWWDHAMDSISSSTSYCTEAYRWILTVQKPETTFESLADSASFVRLDAMLLTALMECIPGDTHLLRQEIKKAKTAQRLSHERNITGRQVLYMVHQFFAMSDKDKSMTDTARLHKVTLQNGDIQQFIYKWDEVLSLMRKRPEDDDLMNLFVLQFDVHLPKSHEFYVEYLFWYNKPVDDPDRCYENIWKLVHDWIRRKTESKNRTAALKDHLPSVNPGAHPKGKGIGKDKNGDPQICFSWRNNGSCARKDAGTCIYAHPMNMKGVGKTRW